MTELGLVRRHSTSTYSTAKDERAAGWEKTVGKGDLDSRLTREVRVCNFIIKKYIFSTIGLQNKPTDTSNYTSNYQARQLLPISKYPSVGDTHLTISQNTVTSRLWARRSQMFDPCKGHGWIHLIWSLK